MAWIKIMMYLSWAGCPGCRQGLTVTYPVTTYAIPLTFNQHEDSRMEHLNPWNRCAVRFFSDHAYRASILEQARAGDKQASVIMATAKSMSLACLASMGA